MKANEIELTTHDGTQIQVYEWLPEDLSTVKGVVQISHGMAEHASRYADFASFLNRNGFAVYANDHRGHGKTAGSLEKVGVFGCTDGWDKLVQDLDSVATHAKKQFPDLVLFVLGHSMGSFALRKFILQNQVKIDGAIISGTGGDPGLLGKVGVMLSGFLSSLFSAKTPSPLMDQMSFGAFNKPFKPNRTKFDWLSKDPIQVDKYVADPYCGGVFSFGFFNQMLKGLLFVSQQKNIDNTPGELPILLFSGQDDPVGDNGKGVTEVYQKFQKAGVKDLTIRLFPDGRHEMLNETNRVEVYEMVVDWLKAH